MFDIGFGELILVLVIGLVVLGPERLPVAVKTVAGWIRVMRSMAANVQNELTQELKLQELQDNLKKMEEQAGKAISPELKASMDELKEAADTLRRSYQEPVDTLKKQLDPKHWPIRNLKFRLSVRHQPALRRRKIRLRQHHLRPLLRKPLSGHHRKSVIQNLHRHR